MQCDLVWHIPGLLIKGICAAGSAVGHHAVLSPGTPHCQTPTLCLMYSVEQC